MSGVVTWDAGQHDIKMLIYLIMRCNKLYTGIEYYNSVYHDHVCSQISTSVQVLFVEF